MPPWPWPPREPGRLPRAELAEALKLDPTLEKRSDVQELRARLPAQN